MVLDTQDDGAALLARADRIVAEASTPAAGDARLTQLVGELAGLLRETIGTVLALQEAQRGWTRQEMSLDPPGAEDPDAPPDQRSWSRGNMAIDPPE
jgi:hypothetical protein